MAGDADAHGCKLCGVRFPTTLQARLHRRRHATGQEYSYDDCGRRYKDKHGLTRHYTVKHGIKRNPSTIFTDKEKDTRHRLN